MATKIIIIGKKGEAMNGRNAFVEVNGERVAGERSLRVDFAIDEVATATVTMILPEIEYRDK